MESLKWVRVGGRRESGSLGPEVRVEGIGVFRPRAGEGGTRRERGSGPGGVVVEWVDSSRSFCLPFCVFFSPASVVALGGPAWGGTGGTGRDPACEWVTVAGPPAKRHPSFCQPSPPRSAWPARGPEGSEPGRHSEPSGRPRRRARHRQRVDPGGSAPRRPVTGRRGSATS